MSDWQRWYVQLPEGAKLTGVPAIVTSAPPGVRTMPATETADGFEIVKSWPATVTIGRERMGFVVETLESEASSGFAVKSTLPSAFMMSAPRPEVLFSPSMLPPTKIVVGLEYCRGPG